MPLTGSLRMALVGIVLVAASGRVHAQCERAKLTAPDGRSGDELGVSVALDGDVAVAGAWYHDSAGSNVGAAYVYRLEGLRGSSSKSSSRRTREAMICSADGLPLAVTPSSSAHFSIALPVYARVPHMCFDSMGHRGCSNRNSSPPIRLGQARNLAFPLRLTAMRF